MFPPLSLSRDIRWHVRVPIDNGQRNCKSKQNVETKECAGGEAEGAENPPWPLAKSTVPAAYSISDRKTNLKYGKQKRNEKRRAGKDDQMKWKICCQNRNTRWPRQEESHGWGKRRAGRAIGYCWGVMRLSSLSSLCPWAANAVDT